MRFLFFEILEVQIRISMLPVIDCYRECNIMWLAFRVYAPSVTTVEFENVCVAIARNPTWVFLILCSSRITRIIFIFTRTV